MKQVSKAISLVVLVTLVFAAGFFVGRQPTATPAAAQTDTERDQLFVPFWEAWETVNSRYVDPVDQEALMTGAIRGMIDAIGDPHSDYLTPEELEDWERSLSGTFEGIGATVRQDEITGALEIVAPLPNSPAQSAGILSGDFIVTVDGVDVTGMDQTEIINMVRGPAGTPVRLGIRREGVEDILEITVIRDVINLPTVEYRLLENNVGYIRLYQFSFEASPALRDALIELDANNLDGLVLDLRGNPGGYLDTSLEIISMFIEDGPILIEQMPGDEEVVFEARGGAIAADVPMVILVDEGSASASELVAGSLRDRERALIVGMPTFGKNTVQTINQISNGGAVRISIARWVTPDGHSSEPGGFIPDVQIEYDPESDPDFDNQLQAAVRALKGMKQNQAFNGGM
jgi:carboxyl-terminal processing protease